MRRFFLIILTLFFTNTLITQSVSGVPGEKIERPKLVIGIVVDQMRWDFLYRYYARYLPEGGFKRMLNRGFSCENTFIPYAPTVTAPGHATIYTGAPPAIHGIAGNDWWDRTLNRAVYCTEDKTVNTVGSTSRLGQQSPRNMSVTTICDELRLGSNFNSKVIGIAIKDRGAIVTAGHSANAAYWYDNTNGNWITSTYYMNDLPQWVKDFNAKKLVDKYYEQGWNLMYPIDWYKQSTADTNRYESKTPHGSTSFPYDLRKNIGKSYGAIATTPFGATLTFEMAKAAMEGEKLGTGAFTDFLAVSISSPDYVGHSYGPNSIEQADNFLRLDKDLGEFFSYLDAKLGANQYLVFLSADHGAAHVPRFMSDNKFPAGTFDGWALDNKMNQQLKDKYGAAGIIAGSANYQVTLNDSVIKANKLNRDEIIRWVVDSLSVHPGIEHVFPISQLSEVMIHPKIKEMIRNGYYPKRGGDIQVILKPHWLEGFLNGGTSHGVWNPYDAHIPLVWYGWGVKAGKTNRETYMTDIAPTIASMLRIQMPSGCVGKVIIEVMK
jgi:predicted AlkP superfamily pyrophosphatase or phosphodiesterase